MPESEEMFETMNMPDHLADTPIWESLYDRGSAARETVCSTKVRA